MRAAALLLLGLLLLLAPLQERCNKLHLERACSRSLPALLTVGMAAVATTCPDTHRSTADAVGCSQRRSTAERTCHVGT
jgi:hypothetical protein